MRILTRVTALALVTCILAACMQKPMRTWRGMERWPADYGGVTAGTFPAPRG